MTIQAWNIVLSAVILVLMTGGGLWLKYVVEQQLKSKDTAIQALEGVVKLKDAQIAGLQGDTAPAITKAYVEMRQHANSVTEEFQKLSVQFAELTKKHDTAQGTMQGTIAVREIMSEANGIRVAFDIVKEHLVVLAASDETNTPELVEALNKVVEQMSVEHRGRREKIISILQNARVIPD